MAMIRLVVDTNNLPASLSKPSAAFRRACGLVGEGIVTVLVPTVFAEEWRTQQLDRFKTQLQKAQAAIKNLLAGGQLHEHAQIPALNAASTSLDALSVEAENLSTQALDRLIAQLQASLIPIGNDHGKRVTSAYFRGAAPFTGIKARKDFPDAFAYEAITDLVNDGSNGPVVVVTADKNLAKHLSAANKITCYENLEDFVESALVTEAITGVKQEAEWQAALSQVAIALQAAQEKIFAANFVSSFIAKLAGMQVFHASIPSDNSDATISMIDDPKNIEVSWDEAEDYGPGVLRVPFSCTSELLLDFDVYYADSYGLPDYISVQSGYPAEHAFFDAQATSTGLVKGHLVVTVEDWSGENFTENASVVVDDIMEIELQEDEGGIALY